MKYYKPGWRKFCQFQEIKKMQMIRPYIAPPLKCPLHIAQCINWVPKVVSLYICFFLGEYKINKDQLAIFILKLKSYSRRKLGEIKGFTAFGNNFVHTNCTDNRMSLINSHFSIFGESENRSVWCFFFFDSTS